MTPDKGGASRGGLIRQCVRRRGRRLIDFAACRANVHRYVKHFGVGGGDEMPDDRGDPKADQLPYYHYRLHRVDAVPMLRRNGDFILRKMRQGGNESYVVSVRWGEDVRHFPVQKQESLHCQRFCFEARCFRRIKDLIDYHTNTGTPLTHESGVRIERPKERQPWELLSRQIETKRKLGRGNFGTVFEAALMREGKPPETVAVKTIDKVTSEADDKVEAARVEMLEEARIMREVSGHPNIVGAVGVTIDQENPMAVMEMVKGNSLEKLVRQNSYSMDEKLRFFWEAASGLGYIHRKRYLHRDMAARNCLVGKIGDALGVLKITDFGMARFVGENQVYKLTKATQMPVAWAALESLERLTWTAESDIWSLGVLAWEIFSNGEMPYNEYESWARDPAITNLKAGKRLEIPSEVPPAVGELLKRCWDANPAKRPKIQEIQDIVKRAMNKV